jgi:tetratricopeptide (TPR) repeat protein
LSFLEEWPEKIRNKLADLFLIERKVDSPIGNELSGGIGRDVTSESIDLIKSYAPDVKILGFQLKAERDEVFAGVQYRAIRNEDDTQRCLQYIYVYTDQRGTVSLLWMVLIPFLMGLWGLGLWQFFSDEIQLMLLAIQNNQYVNLLPPNLASVPLFLSGVVWTPIFLAGIFPHVMDYIKIKNGRWFYARSTTILIPCGILSWLIPFSNIVPFVLIILSIACLLYSGLEKFRFAKSSHDMDYAPVFVWIDKRESEEIETEPVFDDVQNPNHWKFSKACWDYYHYYGVISEADDMEKPWGSYLVGEKRIRLLMDNTWHSFFLGSQLIWLNMASVVLFLVLLPLTVWLAVSGWFWNAYSDSVWIFGTLCFLVVLMGRTAARYPFSLIQDLEDYLPSDRNNPEKEDFFKQHSLNQLKLRILWNLTKKQARYCIISKMQNPFHPRSDFYDTFRDEPEYLLYDYGITSRLTKLEEELAEMNYSNASLLIETERYSEAETALLRAVDMNSNHMQAWQLLRDLLVKTKGMDATIDYFEDIKAKKQDLTAPRLILLGMQKEKKRDTEFEEDVEQTIELAMKMENPDIVIHQMEVTMPEDERTWELAETFFKSKGRPDVARKAKERIEKLK